MKNRAVPKLKLNDYLSHIPAKKSAFVQDLFVGLKDYGFIILSNHSVDAALIDQAYGVIKKFFALPEEVKKKSISPQGGGQRGYTPFGKEHAKDSLRPDLKEFWHVGRNYQHPLYPPNIWPQEIPDFQPVMEKLFAQMNQTGQVVLEALTGPLQLEKNFFELLSGEGNSILRALHYPPIKEIKSAALSGEAVRAAPHGDINLITLLVGATSAGLELKDHDGKWLAVETAPNEIVVDSGDMLSRITADLIPTTIHRVVNPPHAHMDSERYSLPFFLHPHPEADLNCIKSCEHLGRAYPDIKAHDFLMQRLKEIGLYS